MQFLVGTRAINRTMNHDVFRVDVGASATATNVTASGVLSRNRTAHPFHFQVVTRGINCTLTQDSLLVDLGASAIASNVTASGVMSQMY